MRRDRGTLALMLGIPVMQLLLFGYAIRLDVRNLYTAVYDPVGTEGRFSHRPVNTSFLQRLRPTSKGFRSLLPLYPLAMEAFDLRGYDLVVSSSSAWSHLVVVDEPTVHVCYCHNPFRYAWNQYVIGMR